MLEIWGDVGKERAWLLAAGTTVSNAILPMKKEGRQEAILTKDLQNSPYPWVCYRERPLVWALCFRMMTFTKQQTQIFTEYLSTPKIYPSCAPLHAHVYLLKAPQALLSIRIYCLSTWFPYFVCFPSPKCKQYARSQGLCSVFPLTLAPTTVPGT